jgi:hypothetical protein
MPHPKAGYRLADGTRVPGTTTIVGRFKDSRALLWWAFGQGKLAEQGLIGSLYDQRDEAAEAGHLAHDLFEDWICGGKKASDIIKGQSDAVVAQAMRGFDNAVEWFGGTRIEVTDTEMQLVSEKHRFGGCPDAIGVDSRGRKVLLDWKTSSGIYTDYLIQLAAYAALLEECMDFRVEAVHCVRFSRDNADFEHRKFEQIEDAWEQFLIFRRAYDLDKTLKKRVL